MEQVKRIKRIRLKDNTLAWVPVVAKMSGRYGNNRYFYFTEKSVCYAYLFTNAIGRCSDRVMNHDEVDFLEPCSVEEYNRVVQGIFDIKYKANEI